MICFQQNTEESFEQIVQPSVAMVKQPSDQIQVIDTCTESLSNTISNNSLWPQQFLQFILEPFFNTVSL